MPISGEINILFIKMILIKVVIVILKIVTIVGVHVCLNLHWAM